MILYTDKGQNYSFGLTDPQFSGVNLTIASPLIYGSPLGLSFQSDDGGSDKFLRYIQIRYLLPSLPSPLPCPTTWQSSCALSLKFGPPDNNGGAPVTSYRA